MLRTLSLFEKYKTKIDDVGGKKRYILQWSKNYFKSKKTTNGDCYDKYTRSLPSSTKHRVPPIVIE